MTTDIIRDFYSQPQSGLGIAVYSGTRRQLGGSFLSGLARFALPILRLLGGKAMNVASRVAQDVLDDKQSFKESLKRRAREEIIGHGRKPMYINKCKKYKKDIL